jgi:hypothetical protein
MPAHAIAERLERFRRLNDPAVLWPEVTEPAFRRALEEIARVSGAILSPPPDPPQPPQPLNLPTDVSPAAFGVAAFASGMGPLLGYWCETGRLRAADPLAELLARHLDHGRRRAERLEGELGRLLAAFGGRGIEVVLLKGAHTAYEYFPEPGTRPMADLDVLVSPAHLPAARQVLGELGFVAINTEALPHRSDWARPDERTVRSIELDHVDNPWAIDLHVSLDRSYAPGVVARFDGIDTGAGAVRRHFGRPASVLPQPLLLAYLACHAADHLWSLPLLRLAELVLVARRDIRARAAWAGLEDLLARTRTARFAYPTLALAERLVANTVPADVLERLGRHAPRRLRRFVSRTAPAAAQRLEPLGPGHAFWTASLRERLTRLLHLVWPYGETGPLPARRAFSRQRDRLRRLLLRALKRG